MRNKLKVKRVLGVVFTVGLSVQGAFSQQAEIENDFKKATVEKIADLISTNYAFPDVGIAMRSHLIDRLKGGAFDSTSTVSALAASLTREAQSISHDKHLRVRATTPGVSPMAMPMIGDHGFIEARMLDGEIGYLDVQLFVPKEMGQEVADQYMKKIKGSRAVIVDLRKHKGGAPDMVAYLCSYFMDGGIHINSVYNRPADRTRDFHTGPIGGKRMKEVPLFILTSKSTFSAGEEFAYDMKVMKRATLVGETTGGGANPGGVFPVNDKISVFIPTGRAINPITKTNWESVGVVPDVTVEADKALEKAIELAKEKIDSR